MIVICEVLVESKATNLYYKVEESSTRRLVCCLDSVPEKAVALASRSFNIVSDF
jgi:hypothetical protein